MGFFSKFNMKIYKDVFSGDELFSDTYPMSLKNNVMYEIIGKYETRKEGEVVLAGSNASEDAQGEGEGGDEAGAVSGVDIVLNHQLVETGFGDKKGFTAYLKAYMKKVLKYLEENDRAAEIEEFKTNINGVMKELMGSFKDLQFFSGESMDPDAMIAMCEYKDVDGNGVERPVFMFFKHGLEEEKVKKMFQHMTAKFKTRRQKNSFYVIKLIYFIPQFS